MAHGLMLCEMTWLWHDLYCGGLACASELIVSVGMSMFACFLDPICRSNWCIFVQGRHQ